MKNIYQIIKVDFLTIINSLSKNKKSAILIFTLLCIAGGVMGLLFLNIFLLNYLKLAISTAIIVFLIVLITAVICFPLLLAAEKSLENFQID